MGNSFQSESTEQTLADFTQYLNSAVMNAYSDSLSECGAGNSITFNVGILNNGQTCPAGITNSTLDLTQSATSNCNLTATNITDFSSTVQNLVQNTVTEFIQQATGVSKGWLDIGNSWQQENNVSNTQLATMISNNFTGSVTDLCSNINSATNSQTIALCGFYDGDTFNLGQNAMVTALTSCINNIVMNNFTSNQTLNNYWTQTDQAAAAKGSQLLTIIIAAVLLVIILVVVLIGLFFIFKGGGGKKIMETVSGTKAPGLPGLPGLGTPPKVGGRW